MCATGSSSTSRASRLRDDGKTRFCPFAFQRNRRRTPAATPRSPVGRSLLVAPDAESRLAHATAWLRGRRTDEEVLVLAPSMDAATAIVRAGVKGRGASFGWQRLTPGRLASSLAQHALGEKKWTPASGLAL